MSQITELFETGSLKSYQARVKQVVKLQHEAEQIEDAGLKKKQEGSFRRMLDALYWEILEHICLSRLDADQANFNEAEKLLINFGVLSEHQFQEETHLDQLESTLGKFLEKTPYEDDPIYTLSEWASIWQINSQLFDQSDDQNKTTTSDDWIDDEKATKFAHTRQNIYKKLLPTLKALPGSNLNFLRSLLSGEFDKRVEIVLAIRSEHPDKLSINHRRLISMRNTMIDQLKASLVEEDQLKLVALLEKISEAFVKRNIAKHLDPQSEPVQHSPNATEDGMSKKQFINTEISLIKGFLPIGGMEGREFFTSPILKKNRRHPTQTLRG